MFTGLVEALGLVHQVQPDGAGRHLVIAEPALAPQLAIGESVAVNGACLTVVERAENTFRFQAGPETLQRTNLGELVAKDRVNLERSLRLSDRLGGHLVQGHVDGVGKLIAFEPIPESENWWLRIHIPDELDRYVVYKGSIAIEGIGLTVAKLDSRCCTVAIIPHTVEATNLKTLKPGDPVNLETDLIAKYVEKMMMARGEAVSKTITVKRLVREGF